jgi:hypothetical protein
MPAIFSIARPGVNVSEAADKDLVFSSKFYTPKIYRQMYFDVAGTQLHGLDYPPLWFSARYIETDDDEYVYNAFLGYDAANDPQLTVGTWLSSGNKTDMFGEGQEVVTTNESITVSFDKTAVILCVDPLNE